MVTRIFDPFFTTKPSGPGHGAGPVHDPWLRCDSRADRCGSTPRSVRARRCAFTYPAITGRKTKWRRWPRRGKSPRAAAGETVLVVDDEPTIRMLIADVLTDLGYAAIEAEDGASALKVLRSEARVDLLVTDLFLPGGMNGRQLADAARATRPSLPGMFITGYAENALVGNGQLEPGNADRHQTLRDGRPCQADQGPACTAVVIRLGFAGGRWI